MLGAGRLVRFRGLVQDMFNPEYWVGAFRPQQGGPWVTTKFSEGPAAPLPEGAETKVMGGRGAGRGDAACAWLT